jgi:hypothetical protein
MVIAQYGATRIEPSRKKGHGLSAVPFVNADAWRGSDQNANRKVNCIIRMLFA